LRILALSDQIVPFIYDGNVKEHLPGVDLVVSCGDLPARYLEFVLTALNVPLVYVPGNHDLDDLRVPGGSALDGIRKTISGLRLLGMGGSRRYKPRGRHQYTQRQMAWRMLGAYPRALLERMLYGSGLDVIITHSPPLGIHDGQDPAHIGFEVFRHFMRWGRPRYLLHGHQHVHHNLDPTETKYHGTMVINVYPYRVLDIPLARRAAPPSGADPSDG
jgi:Icc-related predicted phosphoesterase